MARRDYPERAAELEAAHREYGTVPAATEAATEEPTESPSTEGPPTASPRVFLSYSHDSEAHRNRALALADRLRGDGVDARLDQYVESPPQGWLRWMQNQIEVADFVLVVATETYNRRFRGREEPGRGRGVTWEGAILGQELYEAGMRTTAFVPVVFTAGDRDHVPIVLRSFTVYDVGDAEGYESLYRRLTGQPLIERPTLGRRKTLPPRRPTSDSPLPVTPEEPKAT